MKRFLKVFICSSFFILHSSFSFAQANEWLWASQGKNGETPTLVCSNIIATDNSGNCFYTGPLLWGDSIHFGAYTVKINDPADADIFLVKFDNNGNVLWAKQSQQNGNTPIGNGYVVSTDGIGNAYIMADFTDTISFDSDTLKTQPEDTILQAWFMDNFLVKYAPDGKVLWARQSEIPSFYSLAAGNSLATDSKGNSYITGGFEDTAYFGGKVVKNVLKGDTISYTFLVKYDANGNVKWAEQSTGHSKHGSEGDCVVANNSGGVFVSGDFDDSVTFGSFKLTCPFSNGDVFLVKYDTNGNVKWARAGIFPSSNKLALSKGITADRFGNVYVAGCFWDTLIFAKDTLIDFNPNSYYTNIFIVKYDADGNMKWAKAPKILDGNGWSAKSLSCDANGNVFMSGGGGEKGLCKICFGNDTLFTIDTSYYDLPGFLVKYDSSGNVICASMVPCGGAAENGVASDTSGNYVYFGGVAGIDGIFGNDTVYRDLSATPFIARWRECEPTLGVSEVKEESEKVKVYPNPSSGQFTFIIASEAKQSQCIVEVYNMLGQQVYSQPNIENSTFNINLSTQSNGVYLYRVITQTGDIAGQGKIVIAR